MDLFSIVAALLTLAALFSYLNHRYIHLPTTIGIMLIAIAGSLAVVGLARDRAGEPGGAGARAARVH